MRITSQSNRNSKVQSTHLNTQELTQNTDWKLISSIKPFMVTILLNSQFSQLILNQARKSMNVEQPSTERLHQLWKLNPLFNYKQYLSRMDLPLEPHSQCQFSLMLVAISLLSIKTTRPNSE